MEKIGRKYNDMIKKSDNSLVTKSIGILLNEPENIDFQINVLGDSHIENWLPNRKKVFWEAFNINSEIWVKQCLKRIFGDIQPQQATYALLGCRADLVIQQIKNYCSEIVNVWDMKGSKTCSVGFANRNYKAFVNYISIGWDEDENNSIIRVDYIEKIVPNSEEITGRLDSITEDCEVEKWIWGEHPYGYKFKEKGTHNFNLTMFKNNYEERVDKLLKLYWY